MRQKVIRSGKHSLAVTVPAPFVHSLGIKAGDSVSVFTNIEKGVVNLKFSGAVQLPLSLKKSSRNQPRRQAGK